MTSAASRVSGQLKFLQLVAIILAVPVLIAGCGERATEPSSEVRIIGPHPVVDGVVQWDPNQEPVLALSVVTGRLDPDEADAIQWRQRGWQLDDTGWRGQDLRVHIDSPGCGYGGHDFVIKAILPDGAGSVSVTVWMEPYICPGSPWLTN